MRHPSGCRCSPGHVRGGVWLLVVLAPLAAALAVAADPVAAQPRPELYRPPVSAPVIDPFRPPDEPWLTGNRGLEYDTEPGTAVHAIGSGLVVFAGPVAGHLYVTVLHGDGIRSSYSYLAAVSVSQGDRVVGGQPVGFTGEVPFHLGARVGGTYIDPAGLFGSPVGAASVFLVPLGSRSGSAPSPGPARSGTRPHGAGGGGVRGRVGSPGTPGSIGVAGAAVALVAQELSRAVVPLHARTSG